MENKPLFRPGIQSGGTPSTPPSERKYVPPSTPTKSEVKRVDPKKDSVEKSVFGKEGYLEKRSLRGKLEGMQDLFTDPNIKMGRDQRARFSKKLEGLLPGNKTTFNPEDVKRVDKKLAQEESSVRGTPKEFEIKRQRAALKKISGLK